MGLRRRDGGAGDADLVPAAAPRQLLDGAPAAIPRRKILTRVDLAGVGAQLGLDEARRLEEDGPVDDAEQPEAGDGVADRHLIRRLPTVLAVPCLGQIDEVAGGPRLDGVGSGPRLRLVVAQPVGQGDDESVTRQARQARHALGAGGLDGRHRLVAAGDGGHDLVAEPAEVLQERQAEHGRDGPDLARREGRRLLVRLDHLADLRLAQRRVGVPQQGRRHGVDTGHPREVTEAQGRQFAVVAARQVVAYLADDFLDDVIVVEEPFRLAWDRVSGGRQMR